MTKNWTRDRTEIAGIAAECCRRGYPIEGMAHSLAQQFYKGISITLAARKLEPLIYQVWRELNGCLTEEQERWYDMATVLQGEGWHPVFDEEARCFWMHNNGVTVNSGGGGFKNYAAATEACFKSAVRDWVKK